MSVMVSFDMIFGLLNGAGCLQSRLEPGQEMLTFRWIPQLYVYQLGRCSRIKQLAILVATPMKGGKNPPQDRLAAEESHAQRFTVARKQLFFCQDASDSAGQRTPQHHWKAVVEPDYCRGAR